MGWRDVLRHPIKALRKTNDDRPARTPYFPRKTYSKVPVTYDTALTLSTVWACVSAITQPLAYMAWHVMQPKRGGGNQIVPGAVDWLLNTQANPDMTAFVFRETLTAWALTWGNGYAEIEQDGAGRSSWLWPISPDRTNSDRTSRGELVYDISNSHQPNTVLPASKIFHLHGLGSDGVMGYSVIALARQSIGLGLATEKFGAEFFGNGLHPGGVAEHPAQLSPTARKNITESLREQMKDAHDILVLEEGMKWNKTTIPPEDAQFLETRQFQVPEICRWFGVPPHKVADLSRATFSNIEHQAIEFVTDSLVPWVKRWETEADIKLFGANRGAFFTKFNVNSLLRGDQASRYAAYTSAIMTGHMTINEARAFEDWNPLPPEIGDVVYRPLNMAVVNVRTGKMLLPQPAKIEPESDDAPEEPLDLVPRNGVVH